MAVLKCKMCGGVLSIAPGITISECEYCGSMQTLPRVSDDRLASFYERANDLRMSHEFDKAVEIYEKIIEENPTDADAYWSMLLCEYGIEYVEEAKSGVRKPTINRAQMVSMFENVNYRSAIKYADVAQRQIYEEEARQIDRILQRYQEISRKEQAYDVFICYKETDENGKRTDDSVYATEIYHKLTTEGLRVFFAPISLKEKLGEDYEPYIFAAIHSAKVMIVIGTKPEYFNAVWVKNEWSRFLTLAKTETDRTLIPVYRHMSPYDMPDAFRYKQAQNMDDIGFLLDLLLGVKKVVRENAAPAAEPHSAQQNVAAQSANVETLLQRARMFLEDGDWDDANVYCEKVLDISPTNGNAYLYKLLAEAQVSQESALATYEMPLDQLRAYKNAVRYADEATTNKLIGYNQKIREYKDRLQRNADAKHRRDAIAASIADNNRMLAACAQERESEYRNYLNLAEEMKKTKKRKRNMIVLSIFVLFFAIGLLATVTGEENVGPGAWVVQIVLSILLASARKKSKIGAFLFAVLSVGVLPGISAIRAFGEAAGLSVAPLQQAQNDCASRIQQLDIRIVDTKNELIALGEKKKAMDAELAKADA